MKRNGSLSPSLPKPNSQRSQRTNPAITAQNSFIQLVQSIESVEKTKNDRFDHKISQPRNPTSAPSLLTIDRSVERFSNPKVTSSNSSKHPSTENRTKSNPSQHSKSSPLPTPRKNSKTASSVTHPTIPTASQSPISRQNSFKSLFSPSPTQKSKKNEENLVPQPPPLSALNRNDHSQDQSSSSDHRVLSSHVHSNIINQESIKNDGLSSKKNDFPHPTKNPPPESSSLHSQPKTADSESVATHSKVVHDALGNANQVEELNHSTNSSQSSSENDHPKSAEMVTFSRVDLHDGSSMDQDEDRFQEPHDPTSLVQIGGINGNTLPPSLSSNTLIPTPTQSLTPTQLHEDSSDSNPDCHSSKPSYGTQNHKRTAPNNSSLVSSYNHEMVKNHKSPDRKKYTKNTSAGPKITKVGSKLEDGSLYTKMCSDSQSDDPTMSYKLKQMVFQGGISDISSKNSIIVDPKSRSGIRSSPISSKLSQDLSTSRREEPSHPPNFMQLNRGEGSAVNEETTTNSNDRNQNYTEFLDISKNKKDSCQPMMDFNSDFRKKGSKKVKSTPSPPRSTKLQSMDSIDLVGTSTKFQPPMIRNHGEIPLQDVEKEKQKILIESSVISRVFCEPVTVARNAADVTTITGTQENSQNSQNSSHSSSKSIQSTHNHPKSNPLHSQLLTKNFDPLLLSSTLSPSATITPTTPSHHGDDNDFISPKAKNTRKISTLGINNNHQQSLIPPSQNIFNALSDDDNDDDHDDDDDDDLENKNVLKQTSSIDTVLDNFPLSTLSSISTNQNDSTHHSISHSQNKSKSKSNSRRVYKSKSKSKSLSKQSSLSTLTDSNDDDENRIVVTNNNYHYTFQHLVNGLSPSTLLDDLPFNSFGTLLGLRESLTFIPDKLVHSIRKCYIHVMQCLLTAIANEADDVLRWWRRLFLLPTVLLSATPRVQTILNIEKVLKDEWDFTLNEFPCKLYIQQEQQQNNPSHQLQTQNNHSNHSNSYKYKRVEELIKGNNLSKAMQVLTNNFEPSEPSNNTFNKLQSKFPDDQLSDYNNETIINNIKQHEPLPSEVLNIDTEQIVKLIRKLKSGVKPGIDRLRNQHLKQLIGYNNEPSNHQQEFIEYLTDIIQIFIHGKEPPEVSILLRDNELFAGAKANGDVRPIGIGCTFRKLAAMCIMQETHKQFNANYFGGLQYACRRNGIEHIYHQFALSLDRKPELDIFNADGENAFNLANRITGLENIRKKFPTALPHLRNMYLTPSTNAWYYGKPDGIEAIDCVNGYHQGDVLASWSYCMTIHPLLEYIRETIAKEFENELCYIKFYVDDGNFIAPHNVMLRIIDILKSNEAYMKYGYKLNQNKGFYLMGKCKDQDEANERKETLLAFGLAESIIIMHPDNQTQFDDDSYYGAKLLGSYLGTDKYITKQLNNYVEEMKTIAKDLMNYPDLQGRLLLFRYCFNTKPNYLFRTIRPELTKEFAIQLQTIQHEILCSIIGCSKEELSKTKCSQCCSSINMGGLGMQSFAEVAPAAYCASVTEYIRYSNAYELLVDRHRDAQQQLVDELSEEFQANQDVVYNHPNIVPLPYSKEVFGKMFSSFFFHLSFFGLDPNPLTATHKLLNRNPLRSRNNETNQSFLTSILEKKRLKSLEEHLDLISLKWLKSIQNKHSGLFLDTIPKMESYKIRTPEFRAALRHRLGIPLDSYSPGLKCNCQEHPTIDPRGLHIVSGCAKGGGPTAIHDALVNELVSILKYAGFWIVKEERDLFNTLFKTDNHRPDITIKNPASLHLQRGFNTVLLDVSVTCPLEGSRSAQIIAPPNAIDACIKGKAAEKRFKEKTNHYKRIMEDYGQGASENGIITPEDISIIPFVFESAGYIHPSALDLLERIAERAEEIKKISNENLLLFFLRRMNICLQKNIGKCMNSKMCQLVAHGRATDDYTFHDRYIVEEQVLIGMNEN